MPNFFSVLVAVLLASIADSTIVARDMGVMPLVFLAAAAPVPYFLGEWIRFLHAKGGEWPGKRALLGFFLASPIALYAALLFAGGWPAFARQFVPGNVEIARFSILLAPYLLLKTSQWIAFARSGGASVPGWQKQIGGSFRLFAFAVLPVLLYLGASDALNQFREARILLESIGLARFAAAAVFFVTLTLVLPMAAHGFWETSPLPEGPLRERLENLSKRLGFRGRNILVWRSHDGSVNAAILGLFPRFRYVILTEGMLSALQPVEVEAVFGHEVGHAMRHHVAAFFGYLLGALLLFLLFAERVVAEQEWVLIAGIVYLALLWILIGAVSRRFELEADLYGASATGDPTVFAGALEKVGAYSGRSRWHGSWRHFSVAERVHFLLNEASDPGKLARFESRMRLARGGGWLCLIAGVALYAGALTKDLPVDLAEWHVRRGEFQEALQKVEPYRFDSLRTRALHTLSETGAHFRKEFPRTWLEDLAPRGRELFLERRFAAAFYYLTLAEMLDRGGSEVGRLARASELLARNEDEELNEFVRHGEGRSLLGDPELYRIFYPDR